MAHSHDMTTSDKVHTCLEYIDQRLESSAEQTIQIAELIIDDIKALTQAYSEAIRTGRLQEHAELVRNTQLNWVNQLQDIILEQTNRDLNGQVILSLQKFANNLNEQQFDKIPFDLPSAVARTQAHNEFEYLSQDEIELLMNQQSDAFESATRH